MGIPSKGHWVYIFQSSQPDREYLIFVSSDLKLVGKATMGQFSGSVANLTHMTTDSVRAQTRSGAQVLMSYCIQETVKSDQYTRYHSNHKMGVEEADLRSENSWQMELGRTQPGVHDGSTSLLSCAQIYGLPALSTEGE